MSDIDPTRDDHPTAHDHPAIEEEIADERERSNQGLIVLAIVAAIALIAAAAWWFSRDPEPTAPSTTATVTTTTETTSAPPTSTVTQTQSATQPTQTTEVTQTADATQTTEVTQTEQATQPAQPPATTQAPTAAASDPNVVNAADYQNSGGAGQGLYFAAAGGDFLCAITGGQVGCQATVVVPSEQDCGTEPAAKAAQVTWQPGGQPTIACTTQGVFVAGPTQGGPSNVELPVGKKIAADGVVCEASGSAVSCSAEDGSGGFTISRDGIRTAS